MLTITLPDDLAEEFQSMAKTTGKTLHECVIGTIRRHLEEQEDRQDYQPGVNALTRKEPTISLAELEKRLGMGN